MTRFTFRTAPVRAAAIPLRVPRARRALLLTLAVAFLAGLAVHRTPLAITAHAATTTPLADFAGLDAVVAHLVARPRVTGLPTLAAAVASDGTWRLRAVDGRVVTASGRYELRTALRWLPFDKAPPPETQNGAQSDLPPPEPESSGPLAILIAKHGLTRSPGALALLPEGVRPFTLINGEVYPVRVGDEGPAYALLHGRLFVALKEDADGDDIVWQLRRRAVPNRFRVVAIRLNGAGRLPRRAPWTPAPFTKSKGKSSAPAIESVTLEGFLLSLPRLSGQTVVVSGDVRDGELVTAAEAQPDPRMRLTELASAARRAGVEMFVIDTDSVIQPGDQNLIWQTVDVAGLGTARSELTLGKIIAALAFPGGAMRVAPRDDLSANSTIAALEIAPRPELDHLVSRNGDGGVGGAIVGMFNEMVSMANGDTPARNVTAVLKSRDRLTEERLRILPGIPSVVQFIYLGLLLLGCLAIPTATRWWHTAWPPLPLTAYRSDAAMISRRSGRLILFLFVFLPAVALAAVPVEIATRARQFAAWSESDRQSVR